MKNRKLIFKRSFLHPIAHLFLRVGVALLGCVLFTATVCGQSKYPAYPIPSNIDENPRDYLEEMLTKHPLLSKMAESDSKHRPSATTLIDELRKIERKIPSKKWPNVFAAGKMPLPAPLITNSGFTEFFDFIGYRNGTAIFSPDQQTRERLAIYGTLWHMLIQTHTREAFRIMKQGAGHAKATTIDIIRLLASVDDWGGVYLEGKPDKADWLALHDSPNPCYRFLSLQYFRVVDQSPEELAQLYRECLFGGCTYLEVSALRSIRRNWDGGVVKSIGDGGVEVAKLLYSYGKLKPFSNDGTLSGYLPNTGDWGKFAVREARLSLSRDVPEDYRSMLDAATPQESETLLRSLSAGINDEKPKSLATDSEQPDTDTMRMMRIVGLVLAASSGACAWWLLMRNPKR